MAKKKVETGGTIKALIAAARERLVDIDDDDDIKKFIVEISDRIDGFIQSEASVRDALKAEFDAIDFVAITKGAVEDARKRELSDKAMIDTIAKEFSERFKQAANVAKASGAVGAEL